MQRDSFVDKIKLIKKFLAIGIILCSGCGGPTQPIVESQHINQQKNKEALPAPNIKVYMENSGSMDGYVAGATEFEYAVYSYLSDIELADLGRNDSSSHKNNIELNYINSEIINQGDDIEKFIKNLEPNVFKQRGGNRGSSDISEILSKVLSKHSKDDISIFISDCIFSPGRQYKAQDNADEYLVNQQIGIRNCFRQKLLESPDYSVIIMRFMSSFDGFYFNKYDDRQKIKENRPFYIWLMGDVSQLQRLMKAVDVNEIKGSGVQNMCVITNINKTYNCSILPLEKIGNFDLDKQNPQTTIVGAQPDSKNGNKLFELTVGVDLSSCLINEDYLLNPAHYELSNAAFHVSKIINNSNRQSAYTHKVKLTSEDPIISRGSITLSLTEKLPDWIEELTDEEGESLVDQKDFANTYGLKYLIGGVFDAYKGSYTAKLITINLK